ncbi:hypothetical protein [Thiolinea disciformis]|uniref:hypothetical protein n=1 Tax=Thiolinea disciformis TaxID=125614 RepID=UPI0003791DCB|nr:hypothetical protein [Thiolinea disciformis]
MFKFVSTLLITGLSLSLMGCNTNPPAVENTTEKAPEYAFTAMVSEANLIDLGRGASTGRMPATRYSAIVQYVSLGKDLKPGQDILIELADKQTSPSVKNTCHFKAPHKHPAFAGKVLILDAEVISCNP